MKIIMKLSLSSNCFLSHIQYMSMYCMDKYSLKVIIKTFSLLFYCLEIDNTDAKNAKNMIAKV